MFSNNNLIRNYILKNYTNENKQSVYSNTNNNSREHIKNINEALPKMPNILNNEILKNTITYKYLDDNILAREFSNEQNYSDDYLLKFCLFNVNSELDKPFLEYFLQHTNNILDFPETILLKELFIDINNQLDESNSWLFGNNSIDIDKINETIENIFLDQIIKIFKFLTNESDENGLKSYRGFMKEQKYIYVFFDCTGLELINNKFIRCILPEISKNENIDTNIVKLFENNEWLMNIKDINNNNIENPNIIYLCNEENNEYINIQNNITDLLYPKIDHKIFGYIYVFTEVPLNKEQNIKRFVSFYSKNIPSLSNLDIDHSVYYFDHNDKTYLAITEEEDFVEL
tara:strand:+ start:4812 stop:5843 length:1032 start_codon:yes stop_codon:yes gene_type:complete